MQQDNSNKVLVSNPSSGTLGITPSLERRVAMPVLETDEGAVFHPSDLRPIVRVVQGPNAGRSAGMFRFLDTQEERSTLTVIPLLIQATRVKWPEGGFQRDSRPECWSTDGQHGARGAQFDGRNCSECPFFTLQPRTGDRDRGICLPTYAVILYEDERGEPVIMRMAGTMARVAPQLWGGKKDPHLRSRSLILTTKVVEGPRGTYYALVVTRGLDLSDARRAEMRELFEIARQVELAYQPAEFEEDATEAGVPARAESGPHPSEIDERDELPF